MIALLGAVVVVVAGVAAIALPDSEIEMQRLQDSIRTAGIVAGLVVLGALVHIGIHLVRSRRDG